MFFQLLFHLSFSPSFIWVCQYGTGVFYFISASPELLKETCCSHSILSRELPSPKLPVDIEARSGQQCQFISTDAFSLREDVQQTQETTSRSFLLRKHLISQSKG